MREEKMLQRLMFLDLKKLQKRTDTAFQLLRRMQEADKNGVVRCISCNAYGFYKSFDAGHFIQRHHLGVRYEPLNVWPQCKKCNDHLHGNHAKYRDGLKKKIGVDGVDHLEDIKDKPPYGPGASWRDWCIEILIHAKKKIKEFKCNS